MSKAVKKIAIIVMAMTMLIGTFVLSGCSEKASKYTEEEHIQRVTERIQKRFIDTENSEFTSFNVYPLHNENDKLAYFLVEFEPYGFIYVRINEKYSSIGALFGAIGSTYTLSSTAEQSWSRYKIDESNSQPSPYRDIFYYETDENGEQVYHKKSPYSVANIENETRYLLHIANESGSLVYIPSIKRDEKYLNLISMEQMDIVEGKLTKKQSIAAILFIGKGYFDL